MPNDRKSVGILTAGGDCPGLNAVIRAVTKGALTAGYAVFGIEDGYQGIIEDRIRPLTYQNASGILTLGGTILGTNNRADPGRYASRRSPAGEPVFENVMPRCVQHLHSRGIGALFVLGGDGSMTVASRFVEAGIPCIGVPKTIDNDLVGTDITFGFMTAVDTAARMMDNVHSTAASHHRAIVVELMGRNAGWLTLSAGIASGADIILIPEMPFQPEAVFAEVRRRSELGSGSCVIAVAEGARPVGGDAVVAHRDPFSADPIRLGGIARVLAQQIEAATGVESRYVVLGHVQRGGPPIPADRVLATQFGHKAVSMLVDSKFNRMVAMQKGEMTDIDITLPAGHQRLVPIDHALVQAARCVRTSFGLGV